MRKFSFQPKREKPEVNMKSNTKKVETEQRDNILPHSENNEANYACELVEQNATCNSVESGKEREDVNLSDENEPCESISRCLPDRNSEGKLCSKVVSHNRQDKWEATEHRIRSSKENNLDVNLVKTSGKNICSWRHLRVPPLSAVDGVTRRLFPETSWSQKRETVHITIHLVGVEHYKCCVSSSHLTFM